jgi:hypothetical protein
MRHAAIGNSKKASLFGLTLFAMLFALSPTSTIALLKKNIQLAWHPRAISNWL